MEHVIGIDIGGTNVKLGIVAWDEEVKILSHVSIPANVTEGVQAFVVGC